MSNPNSQSAWYPPNDRPITYDWMAMVPQDASTSMEQQVFGSVDPTWFNPFIETFPPPVHLGSVPPSVPSDIGLVPGPVSQTLPGRVSDDKMEPFATIYNDSEVTLDGRSLTIAAQMPVDRSITNTERRDDRRSPSPEREDVGQPLRCEWAGCHVGFGRRAELKRHVDTQHIFRSSYKCPKPGCRKSCSRRDNLVQHLRRVHGENI